MPVAKNARGLTVKQDKFAREYARTGNGTGAAIMAGYSPKTAGAIASENLTKPVIAEEVARHRRRIAERLDVSREKLINDAAHDAEAASIAQDFNGANNARTFIAKVQGYLVDRSVNLNVDISGEHLDALMARARARRAKSVDDVVEVGQSTDATNIVETQDVVIEGESQPAGQDDDELSR